MASFYNVPDDCPSPRHGAYSYKSKFDSIYLKLTKYRTTWNVWIASLRSPSQTLKWKAHISPTLIFLASIATCQSGERLARPSRNKFILTVRQSSSSTSSRAEPSLFKKESRCAVYFAESHCNQRCGQFTSSHSIYDKKKMAKTNPNKKNLKLTILPFGFKFDLFI
jgi:hypothetical protein